MCRYEQQILIIIPTKCTNFSNSFLGYTSICIGQFLCPSSKDFHYTHNNVVGYTGLLTACEQDQGGTVLILLASCVTYTVAVCTVKNS